MTCIFNHMFDYMFKHVWLQTVCGMNCRSLSYTAWSTMHSIHTSNTTITMLTTIRTNSVQYVTTKRIPLTHKQSYIPIAGYARVGWCALVQVVKVCQQITISVRIVWHDICLSRGCTDHCHLDCITQTSMCCTCIAYLNGLQLNVLHFMTLDWNAMIGYFSK